MPIALDESGRRVLLPSRFTDTLIAERVYNWQRVRHKFVWDKKLSPYIFPPGPVDFNSVRKKDIGWMGIPYILPHFSTEIGAAWEVLEEMRKRCAPNNCPFPRSWYIRDNMGNKGWSVLVYRFGSSEAELIYNETSLHLPLLICTSILVTAFGMQDVTCVTDHEAHKEAHKDKQCIQETMHKIAIAQRAEKAKEVINKWVKS